MRAIATGPNSKTEHKELTAEEFRQHKSDQDAYISEKERYDREDSYKDKRLAEYPEIGEQLDSIMKWLSTEGEFNVPAELKSIAMKCMSVKAKYPKPKEK